MGLQNDSKINHLMTGWPDGSVRTVNWFEKHGFSRQLLHKYRKSEWLESLGSGAFKKKGDTVRWIGGIVAIQTQMDLRIHVGGYSALDLLGKAHYLRMAESRLTLFGAPGLKLPKWFKTHKWEQKPLYVTSKLFREDPNDFGKKAAGYIQHTQGSASIVMSAAERAILEFLDGAPKSTGYDEALKVIEGLTSLRSNILQTLLERCESIKVKRLFLHLADKAQHQWFQKLDKSRIDLGSGKRLIYKNGYYDPTYKITVPEEARESREV